MSKKKLMKLHKTRVGLVIAIVIELAITYGFTSLSIDRGNLWWYLLALVFLSLAIKDLYKLIKKFFYGGRQTS